MNEIKFAQVTGMTSPNPLTLVCTKKADGDESEPPSLHGRAMRRLLLL